VSQLHIRLGNVNITCNKILSFKSERIFPKRFSFKIQNFFFLTYAKINTSHPIDVLQNTIDYQSSRHGVHINF
jgi:hypothetical protein